MSIWTALFIFGLLALVGCLCVVYLADHDTLGDSRYYDGTNLFGNNGNED